MKYEWSTRPLKGVRDACILGAMFIRDWPLMVQVGVLGRAWSSLNRTWHSDELEYSGGTELWQGEPLIFPSRVGW